jgi:hypothetical protein
MEPEAGGTVKLGIARPSSIPAYIPHIEVALSVEFIL